MNIIFAGTPAFAASALQALLDSQHTVVAVLTQPDRPAGRGQKLTQSAVKQLALAHNLPVHQPLSLKDNSPDGPSSQALLASYNADIMVVVAYGLILPQSVLDIPRLGCLNIHASLLPKWRGAAPIQRALLAGDSHTGVTIMQMDKGLDTGDMLYTHSIAITSSHTSASLHDDLQLVGAQALIHTLDNYPALASQRQIQAASDATYADKLSKQEAHVDWTQPAQVLQRLIRGYQPWPVSYTQLAGDTLRIWGSQVDTSLAADPANAASVGQILAIDKTGVWVQAGADSVLRLTHIQWPGGKALTAEQIFQSAKLRVGMHFE